MQALLEGAANGHDFADRLHLRGQSGRGQREFLEREPRNLGDDIINGRLERGRGLTTGNVVGQLVQRIADRQLGGNLGNREAGGFGGQRRRARDARIHFDDDEPAIVRVDGKLNVGATGFNADFAQDCNRCFTHHLVFLVGQRLRRRHGDGIPGVHTHRIEVFDRTDDDAVVGAVAHDLHLVFFPADQRLFNQQFVGR